MKGTLLAHNGCQDAVAAALGALRPRLVGELLVVTASFVPKSGRGTWGVGWF